jgi:hypothetical protein
MLDQNKIDIVNKVIQDHLHKFNAELGPLKDDLIKNGFSAAVAGKLNTFIYSDPAKVTHALELKSENGNHVLVAMDDKNREILRDNEILSYSEPDTSLVAKEQPEKGLALREELVNADVISYDSSVEFEYKNNSESYSKNPGMEVPSQGSTFENDGNYDLARGIPLERDLNSQRVMDTLLKEGVRFSANNEATGKGEVYLALEDKCADVLSLYDKKGGAVQLDSNRAIKIIEGELFLVPKNKGFQYEKAENLERSNSSPTGSIPPLSPDASDAEKKKREEEMRRQEQSMGKGGFNLFPGRNRKAKPEASASGIDLSSVNNPAFVGGMLMADIQQAQKIMSAINEAGGPMSDLGKDKIGALYDVMDKIHAGFEGLNKSNFDMSKMPNFDDLNEAVSDFKESAKNMKNFIFDGADIMDSPAMKSMGDTIKNAFTRIAESMGVNQSA